MAWKSHWAWHLGSAAADSPNSGGGGNASSLERQIQSLSDRVAGCNNSAKKTGGGRGNAGRRGGRRSNSDGNDGGKKRANSGGNGGKGRWGFNKDGIPKPPGQGKGQCSGQVNLGQTCTSELSEEVIV